jgi:hypothetical protein
MMDEVKPKFRITDSGGFQLALILEKYEACKRHNDHNGMRKQFVTVEKFIEKNTPVDVIKRAGKFDSDIVMGLDLPILNYSDHNSRWREFNGKFPVNLTWANKSIECWKKQSSGSQLMLPLQCYNYDQLMIFLRGLYFDDFSGVALPTRNHTAGELAEMIRVISKQGIRRIHILGSSSLLVIAMMAFLTRNYLEWGSIDSSTWLMAANYRRYIDPITLRQVDLSKMVIPSAYCGCDFCKRWYNTFDAPRDFVCGLATHNYLAIDGAVKRMHQVSTSVESLKGHLLAAFPKKADRDKIKELVISLERFKIRPTSKMKESEPEIKNRKILT